MIDADLGGFGAISFWNNLGFQASAGTSLTFDALSTTPGATLTPHVSGAVFNCVLPEVHPTSSWTHFEVPSRAVLMHRRLASRGFYSRTARSQ